MLVTRGKRVVAEATIRKDVLKNLMRVDTRDLFYSRQISQLAHSSRDRPTMAHTLPTA
jgi:hypothetical protein